METIQVVLIILAFFLLGLTLFFMALFLTEKGMKKKYAVNSIFSGFKQKMWMTAGLGCVFFFIYLLAAYFGSSFKDPQLRLNFFFMVYEHPVAFIYLGLLTFALFSTCIYVVRILIKYLYNTRKY